MYLPLDQSQPNPYDCVPTTASMGCDGTTAGVKRPDPVALRRATGVAYPKGISYIAMTGATAKFGVKSDARFGLSRSQVMALAVSGRDFGISIDCSVTRYTTRRTGTFTGGHTVFVPAAGYSVWPAGEVCACEWRTAARHSEFTVQDPGTYQVGYLQWSAELLFRAAEARTGSGINVLSFPDRTDVYRMGTGTGYVRTAAGGGSKIKAVEKRPYHVIAIASGEPWFRKDGSRSKAWYRVPAGFIRGDKLGTVNVTP